MELREIHIASLQGRRREPHAEQAGIALEGDRPDQDSSKAEQPGAGHRLHDIPCEAFRRRKAGLARQSRDELATSAQIVLDLCEGLHPLRDLRVALRPDIAARDLPLDGQIEVPMNDPIQAAYAALDRVSGLAPTASS